MNVDYLKYFIEACNTGSFQSAANSLYISSQGLGKGINRLEKSLGSELLQRSSTGVEPTEFGKVILNQAKIVQYEIDKLEEIARNYVRDAKGKETEIIKIGFVAKSKYIATVNAAGPLFAKEHPAISLVFETKAFIDGYELLDSIRANEIDIGILFHGDALTDLTYYSFSKPSPLVLLTHRDNPVAKNGSVTIEDIGKANLSLVSAGENDPFTGFVSHLFHSKGYVPNNVIYSTENSYIGGLISTGSVSIILRENYQDVISRFVTDPVTIPIIPEDNVADSVITMSENVKPIVTEFAKFYSEWLEKVAGNHTSN